MSLFKKKEAEKTGSCCCGGNCTAEEMAAAEGKKCCGARVKILGSGCEKCLALEAAAKEALSEMGVDTEVEHVTDFAEIAAYGVMTTPALVVDDKVLAYGKVLKKDEAKKLLEKAL